MNLERLISRHAPHFDVANARLALGRDGNAYLASAGPYPLGCALRVTPDGSTSLPGTIGYAVTAIAANAEGTVATAEAHFSHRVAFWDNRFAPLGQVDDFLDSDAAGWASPSDIQAAPSGDFYAIDQYRFRVLRVNPDSGVIAAYALDRLGVPATGWVTGLRVCEPLGRLYTAWDSGGVRVSSFDGTPLWTVSATPTGFMHGGYDVTDDGHLYVLTTGNTVDMFAPDGTPTAQVQLAAPATALAATELRVTGDELYLKRADPATLFEVYHRTSGALLRRVAADVERLTVTFPSPVWTAGDQVPLSVTLDSGMWPTRPRLRVWWRPLGIPEFTELVHEGDTVTVPADARGLYQMRVSPDVRGGLSEYTVDCVVEARIPGATGAMSILTPLNRFYYRTGEPLPVSVIARGPTPPVSVTLAVRRGTELLHSREVTLSEGRGDVTLELSLAPGRYVLDADVPGFTVAPQHLEVGPGGDVGQSFHVVQHGDYYDGFPTDPRSPGTWRPAGLADLPELTAAHLARARRLGITLFVDRLGHGWQGRLVPYPADQETMSRLTADPVAVAPEKAVFEDPVRRTVAGYGAYGISEQPILLYMDAGLPLGLPYDTRTPEQMAADLRAVTERLLPYPAFRGWSWAANWWLQRTGADAAIDPAEREAYLAALATARETGTWSSVLDTVSDRTFALKPDAEARFRTALHTLAPGKVSAATAPYRAIQSHPPAMFRGA
ncbi:MAG TPA: hypothetical protein VHJ83_16515, partial [Micromonosporaceae bacterium]|nr:hypothetical protein [Micromonosporaceae bacterium]